MSDQTSEESREAILEDFQRTLDANDLIGVGFEVRDGTLFVAGTVETDEAHQAVLDLATPVVERLGLQLDDSVLVQSAEPDSAFTDDDEETLDFGYVPADSDLNGEVDETLDLEPDYAEDPGTVDLAEIHEQEDTFFAPTDTVVRTSNDYDGVDVLGGFSDTSMDTEAAGTGPLATDDLLGQFVLRELREDAYTSDMDIRVFVDGSVVTVRGVVDTLEDAEYVESVAGRVPGVEEVREELAIRQLGRSGEEEGEE